MVERARLEIVYVPKRGIEGSNPSLSTKIHSPNVKVRGLQKLKFLFVFVVNVNNLNGND